MDIIGQIEASNTKAIEEPKEVLTLNVCRLLIFFNREYENWRDFCVRRTNSRNGTNSRIKPRPTYFSMLIWNKTIIFSSKAY